MGLLGKPTILGNPHISTPHLQRLPLFPFFHILSIHRSLLDFISVSMSASSTLFRNSIHFNWTFESYYSPEVPISQIQPWKK